MFWSVRRKALPSSSALRSAVFDALRERVVLAGQHRDDRLDDAVERRAQLARHLLDEVVLEPLDLAELLVAAQQLDVLREERLGEPAAPRRSCLRASPARRELVLAQRGALAARGARGRSASRSPRRARRPRARCSASSAAGAADRQRAVQVAARSAAGGSRMPPARARAERGHRARRRCSRVRAHHVADVRQHGARGLARVVGDGEARGRAQAEVVAASRCRPRTRAPAPPRAASRGARRRACAAPRPGRWIGSAGFGAHRCRSRLRSARPTRSPSDR